MRYPAPIRALLLVACAAGLMAPMQLIRAAELTTGQVVAVIDGDSLRVLVDGRLIQVRLADIDTPEECQAFGMQASETLASLVYDRQVLLDVTGKDK